MFEKIKYQGLWFIPEDSDNKYPGTLIYDPFGNSLLEIHGTFQKHQFDFSKPKFILGIVENEEKITLVNNRVRKLVQQGITIYITQNIIEGGHFTNEEEILFDKMICRLYPFDDWLGITHYDPAELIGKENVSFGKKDAINVKVNEGLNLTIEFQKAYSERWNFYKYIEIGVVSFAIFTSKTPINIKQFLHNLFVFNSFLSFMSRVEAFPISIQFKNEQIDKKDGDANTRYDFYTKHENVKQDIKELDFYDIIINFPPIANHFEKAIQNWFLLFNDHQICFEMFYEPMLAQKKFRLRLFLNLVNSLEALHRRLCINEIKNKAHIDNLINEIINSIEDRKDRKFIKGRLKHIGEPSLLERLINLRDNYCSDKIKNIITNKDLQEAVDIRNYYNHPDKKKESYENIQMEAIYKLYLKLRVNLMFMILKELDIPEEIYIRHLQSHLD